MYAHMYVCVCICIRIHTHTHTHTCICSYTHTRTHSENKRCVCAPYWTGEDCSSGLCPFGCSGHGMCQDGLCVCDPGWAGVACADKLCLNDCSGHGTCNGGKCECQTGYAGDTCQFLGSCSPECLYGSCVSMVDGNATCACDMGWQGIACDQRMTSQSCPGNCTGHGTCQTNGTCACDVGWYSPDCSDPLRMGVNVTCPNGCNGHGACLLGGVCACDAGYAGRGCELEQGHAYCARNCSTGSGTYRNGSCECVLLASSGCQQNCSGHGVCSGAQVNDTCVCDFGFVGAACADISLTQYVDTRLLLSGGCAGNCSGHGACANSTCVCDTNWLGADCSFISADATGAACPMNCSSRGACTGNSTCLCDAGFVGITCEEEAGSEGCLFNCSARGTCDANQTCACDLCFTGIWCEIVDLSFVGATPMPSSGVMNVSSLCDKGCSGRAIWACVCLCLMHWRLGLHMCMRMLRCYTYIWCMNVAVFVQSNLTLPLLPAAQDTERVLPVSYSSQKVDSGTSTPRQAACATPHTRARHASCL